MVLFLWTSLYLAMKMANYRGFLQQENNKPDKRRVTDNGIIVFIRNADTHA